MYFYYELVIPATSSEMSLMSNPVQFQERVNSKTSPWNKRLSWKIRNRRWHYFVFGLRFRAIKSLSFGMNESHVQAYLFISRCRGIGLEAHTSGIIQISLNCYQVSNANINIHANIFHFFNIYIR